MIQRSSYLLFWPIDLDGKGLSDLVKQHESQYYWILASWASTRYCSQALMLENPVLRSMVILCLMSHGPTDYFFLRSTHTFWDKFYGGYQCWYPLLSVFSTRTFRYGSTSMRQLRHDNIDRCWPIPCYVKESWLVSDCKRCLHVEVEFK